MAKSAYAALLLLAFVALLARADDLDDAVAASVDDDDVLSLEPSWLNDADGALDDVLNEHRMTCDDDRCALDDDAADAMWQDVIDADADSGAAAAKSSNAAADDDNEFDDFVEAHYAELDSDAVDADAAEAMADEPAFFSYAVSGDERALVEDLDDNDDSVAAGGATCALNGECAGTPGDEASRLAAAHVNDGDEGDEYSDLFGLAPLDESMFSPEPVYTDDKFSPSADAATLCKAVKGLGVRASTVREVLLSTRRSFDYLQLVRAEFKKTSCKSYGPLRKWIEYEFTCAEEVKLVEALTSRKRKLEIDRETLAAADAAKKQKNGIKVGDTRKVNEEMTLLSFSEQDGVVSTCGKGLFKGVKFAVEGYIQLAKMGWSAMKKLATDPIGALQKTGCAVKAAGKWLWKKAGQAVKWVRQESVKWVKTAFNDVKKWVAKPCTTGPLFCVFEKALRAPFDLFSYVMKKIIAAVSYVWKNTLGKVWDDASTKRRVRLICWTFGFVGFELAMIPVVPMVFGFVARKLAQLSNKIIPLVAKLFPKVGEAALRSTMVGRWTSKNMIKVNQIKAAKASSKADKLGRKLSKKTSKLRVKTGKPNAHGFADDAIHVSGRRARKLDKLATKQQKYATKAKDARAAVAKYEADLAAGMQKLAARDVATMAKLGARSSKLGDSVTKLRASQDQLRKTLDAARKAGDKAATKAAMKRVAKSEAQIAQLMKKRLALRKQRFVMAKELKAARASGKPLDAAARKAMLRRAKSAYKAAMGPGFVSRQVTKLKSLISALGKHVAKSPFVRVPREVIVSMVKSMGKVRAAASAYVRRATEKLGNKVFSAHKYRYNPKALKNPWKRLNKNGKWVYTREPHSLAVRLRYRSFPKLAMNAKTFAKKLLSAPRTFWKDVVAPKFLHRVFKFQRAKADRLLRTASKQAKQAKQLHAVALKSEVRAKKALSDVVQRMQATNPKPSLFTRSKLQYRKRMLTGELKKQRALVNVAEVNKQMAKKQAEQALYRVRTMANRQRMLKACVRTRDCVPSQLLHATVPEKLVKTKAAAEVKKVCKRSLSWGGLCEFVVGKGGKNAADDASAKIIKSLKDSSAATAAARGASKNSKLARSVAKVDSYDDLLKLTDDLATQSKSQADELAKLASKNLPKASTGKLARGRALYDDLTTTELKLAAQHADDAEKALRAIYKKSDVRKVWEEIMAAKKKDWARYSVDDIGVRGGQVASIDVVANQMATRADDLWTAYFRQKRIERLRSVKMTPAELDDALLAARRARNSVSYGSSESAILARRKAFAEVEALEVYQKSGGILPDYAKIQTQRSALDLAERVPQKHASSLKQVNAVKTQMRDVMKQARELQDELMKTSAMKGMETMPVGYRQELFDLIARANRAGIDVNDVKHFRKFAANDKTWKNIGQYSDSAQWHKIQMAIDERQASGALAAKPCKRGLSVGGVCSIVRRKASSTDYATLMNRWHSQIKLKELSSMSSAKASKRVSKGLDFLENLAKDGAKQQRKLIAEGNLLGANPQLVKEAAEEIFERTGKQLGDDLSEAALRRRANSLTELADSKAYKFQASTVDQFHGKLVELERVVGSKLDDATRTRLKDVEASLNVKQAIKAAREEATLYSRAVGRKKAAGVQTSSGVLSSSSMPGSQAMPGMQAMPGSQAMSGNPAMLGM